MKRQDILAAAGNAVADREGKYGSPAEHFATVARAWSVAFGWKVEPRDIPLAMTLLKVIRQAHAHGDDNLIDIAGYASLAGELAEP